MKRALLVASSRRRPGPEGPGFDESWLHTRRRRARPTSMSADTQCYSAVRNLNSADDVGCDTQWEFNLRNLNSADIRRQTHRHPCTSRVVGFADRVGFGNARAPHLPMSVPRRARRRPQSSSRLSGALRQATAAELLSAALLSAAPGRAHRLQPAAGDAALAPRWSATRRSPTLAVAPWNFVEIDQAVFAPQHRQ